ncbi:putative transcription factor AP2-EREBP family [Medicago truncatula]|uniref:Putative transcription factor AP2-EREBP family n=1 Tax=Medicago truncatula TaxID=3880 RepID=G7IIR3_MEDTR|nr:ethylene-responsive transcription factor ERF018 [Medicago truncatula]AES65614.1 TINY transcription factor [Medicago truncatula]RHN73685.1 putative transcription factor AP2-EREBP family [Medicago truncatula]
MVKSNMEKIAVERSDSSLYRGVRKRKWGKYVSEIRLPNSRQRIWLGSYDSDVKAARAFDAAMFCLRGSGAKFNFPNDPPEIAGGRSMTHSEIKTAAARFANSGQVNNEYSGQPDNSTIETPSWSQGTTFLPMDGVSTCYTQVETPSLLEGTTTTLLSSPALSDVTVQTDSDLGENGLCKDLFSETGLGYTMFPGFYDFCGDFYVPELTNFAYEEENMDGLIIQDSFLWNF